jgi:hypothetical protein
MITKSCFFSLFLAGALLLQVNSMGYTVDIIKMDIDTALDKCSQCHMVVEHLQAALRQGNHTVGPLLELIERICHLIFGPAAKECYDITHNATDFVNYILTHNATYLCEQIGDC